MPVCTHFYFSLFPYSCFNTGGAGMQNAQRKAGREGFF